MLVVAAAMMKLFARVRVEVSDELERDKSFLLGLAALVLDLESENGLPSLALRRREGARERVENERGREEARDAPDHADGERHRKVETALRLAVRHARDEERQDGRDEVRRRGEEEPAREVVVSFRAGRVERVEPHARDDLREAKGGDDAREELQRGANRVSESLRREDLEKAGK